DFEQALKDQIKGKVALIDRGKVAFSEKIKRAQDAGAIGVVVANNADGDPIAMGGDGSFDIPGMMITKAAGITVKAKLALGVMTLLKQKYKELNTLELKSVLMGHGKVIADEKKKIYSVSRQGAGRVQVADSINAKLVTVPASLSFGLTDIEKQKTLSKSLLVKNISAETLTLKPEWS